MMWQRVLSPDVGEIDPEHEKELRLVAQARAGAAWALSALVARYQPPVVRYLVRLTGSAERGRSLAEDVLVRMAKRVRGPHGGDHLRLWLLRAATEVGLDALRHPYHADPRRLGEATGPVALIAGRVGDTPVGRWVAGWGTRMRQQTEPRQPVRTQQFIWQESAETPAIEGEDHDQLEPREALKYRVVRAVLAELPYGDAQCLSLHLVAGLNQTEVAQALGIAPAVARRRIVQGLQLFGRRYEAALAGLGLPPDHATAEAPAVAPSGILPAETPDAATMVAPSLGVLDSAGVVDAEAVTQPLEPAAGVSARASQMELPVVRLASPVPDQTPITPETEDAEERVLTSAAIMAYLRSAAAHAQVREQLPAIVEADTSSALPGPADGPVSLEPVPSDVSGGHRDDTSAQNQTGGASRPAEQADVIVPAGIDEAASPPSIETKPGKTDAVSAVLASAASSESMRTSVAEDVSPADPAVAVSLREPRLVPVFDSVDAAAVVPEPTQQDQQDQSEPLLPLDALALDSPLNAYENALVAAPPAAPPNVATPPHLAGDDEDQATSAADSSTPPVSSLPDSSGLAAIIAGESLAAGNDEPHAATHSEATEAEALAATDEEGADVADDTDHYVLVVDAEREPPTEDHRLRLLRARRTQVLSADGEAEDPTDAAIWPVS